MLTKVKNFLYKVKIKSGLTFYTKPQVYDCAYTVVVKNGSSKKNLIKVILPIPPNSDTQKLIRKFAFSPGNALIKKEPRYGNEYAIWNEELLPGESKTFQQTFEIEVRPYEFSRNNSASIDWLKPNKFIQSENFKIKELAKNLKGNEKNVIKIAKKFNDYLIENLTYGNPILELYSSMDAIEKDQVDCGGFDTLFAALCVASKIPARVVNGFLAGYKNNSMHVWAEFMAPDGRFIPVDPSMEQFFNLGKTRKSGKFGFVGSDRIALSYGCDLELEEKQIAILQNPSVYSKLGEESLEIESSFKTNVI